MRSIPSVRRRILTRPLNIFIAVVIVGAVALTQQHIRTSFGAAASAFVEAENAVLSGLAEKLGAADVPDASQSGALRFGALPPSGGGDDGGGDDGGTPGAHPNADLSGATSCATPAGLELQDQDLTDEDTPWRRTGPETTFYFETTGAIPEHVEYIKKAAVYWSRSVCIDARAVATCPANAYCVTVSSENAGGGDTDGEHTGTEEGEYRVGSHIQLFTDVLNQEGVNSRLVTTVHEYGHAIGLRHRATEGLLMYQDTGEEVSPEPDKIDFENILVLYGNQQY
ncbi:matrixin family metalloprotease [Candidatus Saccharibacteria bacterium]|nr:matrixin family metalloprotease [Candidatus Saccharibacteria bacterium]